MKPLKLVIARPKKSTADEYRANTGKVLSAINTPQLKKLIAEGVVELSVRPEKPDEQAVNRLAIGLTRLR